MGSFSKGIKAGLAAGVIYAAMIGLLHTGFLTICAPYQLAFIQNQTATINPTTVVTTSSTVITTTTSIPSAQDIFNTDLVYFSLEWAIAALFAGVIYGAIFGALYSRLPGSSSKKKGLYMSIFVFALAIIFGLSGWEVGCSPDYYHAIPVLANIPISAVFGYLLGKMYDSFGALEIEEKEIARQKEAEKDKKDIDSDA